MQALHVTVRGEAKSKGSLNSYGPGQMVEAVEGSSEWREIVAWNLRRAMRSGRFSRVMRPDPCRVELVFRFDRGRRRGEHPTTRSTYDVDKLARNVLDALQDGGVIDDDSQVTHLTVSKRWATPGDPPGVSITVTS